MTIRFPELPRHGSLALRVYEALLARILKLEQTFPRVTVYQKAADSKRIITVGTDTYDGNKVDPVLTLNKEYGGLELDAVNGRLVNGSDTIKKCLFDAVATVSNPAANNTKIWFSLFKNDTEILEQTTSYIKLETQTGAGTLNAATEIDLEPGEYIEVFCKTDKLNGEFDVEHIQLRLIAR